MSAAASFDEDDWSALSGSDKKALQRMLRAFDFEPLANLPGVGIKSIDTLMEKGLVVEGELSLHGRTFKLTNKGILAVDWIRGGRTQVYPGD